MRDGRLAAAGVGARGQQIMTFEQAAVRLAGGFSQPVDGGAARSGAEGAFHSRHG